MKAYVEILGDRDPLEVQEELLPAIKNAIDGMSEANLRRPEAPGRWSIIQILQHLADIELVFSYRIRMMIAQPVPEFPGTAVDDWARELHYDTVDLDDALDQLRALRQANLRLLRSADPSRLDRYYTHKIRGRETVGMIVYIIAGHDLIHLRQIKRIQAAIA